MHIEFDVLEVLAVILGYFSIKWGVRVLLMGVVAKVVAGIKEKASEAIQNAKQSFESFERSETDARNER